jgi:hypothetical protein
MLVALAAVVMLLGAGACTKENSDESVSSAATDPAVDASVAPNETTADDDRAADPVDEPLPDDDGTTGESDGNCPTQSVVDALEQSLDGVEDLDPSNMSEAGDAVQTALDQMAGYLPAGYDADVETLREGLTVLFGMYGSIDMNNPTPEQIAEIEATMSQLDEAELEAASSRIEQYFTDNCPDVVFPE